MQGLAALQAPRARDYLLGDRRPLLGATVNGNSRSRLSVSAGGNAGSFDTIWDVSEHLCQEYCTERKDCVAYEYGKVLKYRTCELHNDLVRRIDRLLAGMLGMPMPVQWPHHSVAQVARLRSARRRVL